MKDLEKIAAGITRFIFRLLMSLIATTIVYICDPLSLFEYQATFVHYLGFIYMLMLLKSIPLKSDKNV